MSVAKKDLMKMNNSEYAFFMRKLIQDIEGVSPENIGLSEEFLTVLKENVQKITVVLSSSHASRHTVILQELDAKRDALLLHLFSSIRTSSKLPMIRKSNAANALEIIIKPFSGVQRLPLNQETLQIFSLEAHLSDPETMAHIATLGLTEVVAELIKINQEYDHHSDERNEEMAVGNCADIRIITDEQYHHIISMAEASMLIKPSPEVAQFIESLNHLIKETKTAYNQRTAQHKRNASDEEVTTEETTEE